MKKISQVTFIFNGEFREPYCAGDPEAGELKFKMPPKNLQKVPVGGNASWKICQLGEALVEVVSVKGKTSLGQARKILPLIL